MAKTKTITLNREVKHGRFVTEEYVKTHKGTTVTEHRKVPVTTPKRGK